MELMNLRRGLMAQMAGNNAFKKIGSVTLESAITTTEDYANQIENLFNLEMKKMYYFEIKGNTSTSQYKAIESVQFRNSANEILYIFVRSANATASKSVSWLFDITAGSIIEAYEAIA